MISPGYSELLREKHRTDSDWGSSGVKFFDRVNGIITDYSPDTILDYGCGKGALAKKIREARPGPLPAIALYDPGIPEICDKKTSADMVICTDVLEHIEPELLENVIVDIGNLTKRIAYFVIFSGDCGHKLPDGRPCHLIQMPPAWWEAKLIEILGDYFDIDLTPIDAHRFEVVVTRRSEPLTAEQRAEREAIVAGLKDPVPEDPADPAPVRKGKSLLGSFGGNLVAKEG